MTLPRIALILVILAVGYYVGAKNPGLLAKVGL